MESRFDIPCVKGDLSLDRCTFLVFSPRLSLWGDDCHDGYVKKMAKLTEKLLKDTLDVDFCQGVPSELFKHHFRTTAGVDVQFGAFYPKRKKIDPLLLVQSFGSDASAEDDTPKYTYLPNDYGFRIEYNPNTTDLSSVLPLLQNFARSGITSSLVRLARLDVAIDYKCKIDPGLALCDRMRKSFVASGPSGIETLYFGSRSSQFYIRLYNKALELREKKSEYFSGDMWRFELEVKKSFLLSHPPDLGKVLRRFSFFSAGVQSFDWKLRLLLAYAKDHGLKSALALLPPASKKRYTKAFLAYDRSRFVEPPFEVYEREFAFKFSALRYQILSALGHKFEDNPHGQY